MHLSQDERNRMIQQRKLYKDPRGNTGFNTVDGRGGRRRSTARPRPRRRSSKSRKARKSRATRRRY